MFKSKIGNSNISFQYLYSSKDVEQLHNYFKMKNKYEYRFEDNEENDFINMVFETIGLYDYVITPETSGKTLSKIAEKCGVYHLVVEKETKENIKAELLKQKLMKHERISLLNKIDNKMDDSFKINLIKGNQRHRFIDIMFKNVSFDLNMLSNKKVLILDDSIFSGETFKALKSKINIESDNIVLYSKL